MPPMLVHRKPVIGSRLGEPNVVNLGDAKRAKYHDDSKMYRRHPFHVPLAYRRQGNPHASRWCGVPEGFRVHPNSRLRAEPPADLRQARAPRRKRHNGSPEWGSPNSARHAQSRRRYLPLASTERLEAFDHRRLGLIHGKTVQEVGINHRPIADIGFVGDFKCTGVCTCGATTGTTFKPYLRVKSKSR